MRCWAASSTIRAACAWIRKSMPTDNAPKRLSTIVEKACTMSASLRTSNSSTVSRSCDATALVASHCGGATGLPRLFRCPKVETDGKASLSNSIRLPDSSVTNALRPVTLPPGRASDATTPTPSGSPMAAMTMGTVVVAAFAARAAGVPRVTIRSTRLRTSSATSLGETLALAVGRAVVDVEVLPLHVSELTQPVEQRRKVRLVLCPWNGLQDADGVDLRLRAHRKRPRG